MLKCFSWKIDVQIACKAFFLVCPNYFNLSGSKLQGFGGQRVSNCQFNENENLLQISFSTSYNLAILYTISSVGNSEKGCNQLESKNYNFPVSPWKCIRAYSTKNIRLIWMLITTKIKLLAFNFKIWPKMTSLKKCVEGWNTFLRKG